jgi:hypothetical protein
MTVPGTSSSKGVADRLGDLLDERLADADAELASRYPGDPGTRQPVHTVYVPADRATGRTHREWGDAALRLLDEHAPSAADLTAATGVGAEQVLARVRDKLARQPVEDLRIDFEDGYGVRPGDEEDEAAAAAAAAIAAAARADDGPTWTGIRFKSLEAPTRRRGLRTLELVLAGVLEAGDLPGGFVLTLPRSPRWPRSRPWPRSATRSSRRTACRRRGSASRSRSRRRRRSSTPRAPPPSPG